MRSAGSENAGPEWAGSGKQDWRRGTNRQPDQGAELRADPDPKGVDWYRQQDCGHGSRNQLRSV